MTKAKEIGLMTESANALEYIAHAQLAESMGFGSFWVPENYAMPAAFTALGAIAASTSTIKLGTGVVNPYTRHPVLLAMELAALDQISNGRAILGLGGGIKLWIEEQMSISYDRPVSAMRETVSILRRLFSGETVEHEGRVFNVGAGMRFSLEPHRTHVPIYLGATGPRAQELAGEVADGFFPFFCEPESIRAAIKRVKAGAVRGGRDLANFDMSALLIVSVGNDDRVARDAIKPALATFFAWFANQPELPLYTEYGLSPDDVEVIRKSYAAGEIRLDMVSEAVIDGLSISGSPERCREKLAGLIDAGITKPIIAPYTLLPGSGWADQLEWLQQNLLRDFM
jgi:5,10-methylenetetrahydromethanopterin reductase